MSRFSEREGHRPPQALQNGEVNRDLRHSLFNVILKNYVGETTQFLELQDFNYECFDFARDIWIDFFKEPVHQVPSTSDAFRERLFHFVTSCVWYKLYDLLEFIIELPDSYGRKKAFVEECNHTLEREISGFRFLNNKIVSLMSTEEKTEVENGTAHSGKYLASSKHLQNAIDQFAKRPEPDFANCIKESISAVESACKIAADEKNMDLAGALKKLKLHPAFRQGVGSLYGWTSAEGGVRHGAISNINVGAPEARYMLVSCAAFTNFIIGKFG